MNNNQSNIQISILTLVNHYEIYNENVIDSTLKENSEGKVEYIVVDNPPYASKGINEGIKEVKNDLILYCHQDISFKEGWYEKLLEHIETLEKRDKFRLHKRWGVLGFAGTTDIPMENTDRGIMVGTHSGLGMDDRDIIKVQTLDCSILIFKKSTFNRFNLKFDENLKYFHAYGEDICLQAISLGLGVYVINVPVIHNCKWTSGKGINESFRYLRRKWDHRFQRIYTTVGTWN